MGCSLRYHAAVRLLWAGLLLALALASCASPGGVVPDPPGEGYRLPSWPRQSISLEVVDSRDRREGSEGLVQLTQAILADALNAAAAPPAAPRHLLVEIVMYEVSLQGPLWIGVTRFRATLFDGQNAVRTWEARGEQRVMNHLAQINAKMAIQDGYHRAVAELISRLDQAPP
jgi:hypothetical protein